MRSIQMLTILLLTSLTIFAQSLPEEVIHQYENAIINDDWDQVSELTASEELSSFRKNLTEENYKFIASSNGITNIDSVRNYSDRKLYSLVLKNIYLLEPSLKDTIKKTIIGTIYQRNDYAYVVYKRNEKYINTYELIKDNDNWKLMKLDVNVEYLFYRYENNLPRTTETNSTNSSNSQTDNLFDTTKYMGTIKNMMGTILDFYLEDSVINKLANFDKKYFDALIKIGFNKDDAIKIISNSKLTFGK